MDEKIVSRRQFLLTTGLFTSAGLLGLAGCAPQELIKEVPKEVTRQVQVTKEVPKEVIKEVIKEVPKEVIKEVVKEVPKWPWPYAKLDVEQVRKKAHFGYYQAACCYGSFWAVVDSLREKIGFPYTQMPTDFMTYGVGGLADTASLCGAINGAAAAMTLVLGKDDWKKIVKELVNWYTKTPFPSDISNQYAKDHKFLVEKYKSDKVFVSSVSRSTLCHVSVTKWCKASGYASGSDERSERCGRLTADVAAQAVVLLNQFADKNFKAVTASPASAECVPCHSLGKDYKLGQYTRGEEDCVLCHTPHEIKK